MWPRLACYWTLKVAFTVAAPVMVTEQVALLEPEHAPPQPAKVEPALGTAVRVTTVPLGKVSEHLAPQSMRPGADVTTPEPLPPVFVTESS